MRTKSLILSYLSFLCFPFAMLWVATTFPYFSFSQNVGIGTTTPAYRLDVNGVINSNSEYRLSGKTIFRWSNPSSGIYTNFSAGDSAGFSNTSGFYNTFIGGGAGNRNVSGNHNTYIGLGAGYKSIASDNTFVGSAAGFSNETGEYNAFLGSSAGVENVDGFNNTFLGAFAGSSNQSGARNVFVGNYSGDENITGHFNTLLGQNSGLGSSDLSNATAIGRAAYVTQSNSLVLGSIAGINGATQDTRVGIGTTSPDEKLEIVGNIKVSGEVNHPSTGAANLLPIAFGSVSSAGVIHSGSENFTVTRTAAGSYTIGITNHSYSFSTYSTVITAVSSVPLVAVTNSQNPNLFVRLYNLSGVLTDGTFHFVVHKQ
ncbi:MAG TPA: hypothetical protein VIZ28_07770 [Chitinophagaceae bacterium]